MIARLRKGIDNRDQGFTLIELLVVMIIIGILAAIAIPTFLNQRKNGWRSAVKSDLKNAALGAESWATDQANGSFAGFTTATLDSQRGTGVTADVTVAVAVAGVTGYCLTGVHSALTGETFYYNSLVGAPGTVSCTGVTY